MSEHIKGLYSSPLQMDNMSIVDIMSEIPDEDLHHVGTIQDRIYMTANFFQKWALPTIRVQKALKQSQDQGLPGGMVNLQIRMALPGRCTPFELTYGKQPNVINLRIFGCEALAYREKDKRVKFQPKVDQCVYLGMSTSHSDDTYKLLNLKSKKVIYRRQVFFNERSFPARKQKVTLESAKVTEDTAEDIIGLPFEDDGEKFIITGTSRNKDGELVVDYKDEKGKDLFSSVKDQRGSTMD